MGNPSLTLAYRYAPPADKVAPPPVLPAGMPSPYMPVDPRDPSHVFTTTFSPSTGLLQSSYWRKLNQRLEMATEVQILTTPGENSQILGKREGIATFGFKLDTVFATIRACFDSHGKVCTVLEERIAPGVAFQLSGEMNYGKGQGGEGKVGIGFTMEL